MVRCSVFGCNNCSAKGFKLYSVPTEKKDKERRNIWISRSRMLESGIVGSLPIRPRVCEVHFDHSQFEPRVPGKLKQNAIPSIFPDPATIENLRKKRSKKTDHDYVAIGKTSTGASDSSPTISRSSVIGDFNPVIPTIILPPGMIPVFPNYMLPENCVQADTSNEQQDGEKQTACIETQNDSADIYSDHPFYASSDDEFSEDEPIETETKPGNSIFSLAIKQNKELAMYKRKYKNSQSQLSRLRRKIAKLRIEKKELAIEHKKCSPTLEHQTVEEIKKLAKDGDIKAIFLLEQISSFKKLKPRWSEEVVRYCFLWKNHCPSGYKYVKDLGILTLPPSSRLNNVTT